MWLAYVWVAVSVHVCGHSCAPPRPPPVRMPLCKGAGMSNPPFSEEGPLFIDCAEHTFPKIKRAHACSFLMVLYSLGTSRKAAPAWKRGRIASS